MVHYLRNPCRCHGEIFQGERNKVRLQEAQRPTESVVMLVVAWPQNEQTDLDNVGCLIEFSKDVYARSSKRV